MTEGRPRRRPALWAGVLAVLCVVGGGAGFAIWSLDPARLKPRLIEAAERATGRTLTISGDVALKLSFLPTLTLEDVALSNPPGASRPEMLRAARVEVSFALAPLLRRQFEIDRIDVKQPDILLETDGTGRPNWIFSRESRAATAAPDASAGGPRREPFAVSIRNISVAGGRLGWLDGRNGRRLAAEIPKLAVTTPADGQMEVVGTLTYAGQPIALTGHANPPRDPGTGDPAPWPIALRLAAGNATVAVEGHVGRPPRGRGYALTVDAAVPDPPAFAAWFPRLPLRALHGLTVRAELGDSDGRIPVVSGLAATAQVIDIGAAANAARLEDVSLSGRGDAPLTLAARVEVAGAESGISARFGDLGWLNRGAGGPVTVDLEWNAASARGSVKGTIQTPRRLSGVALDVAVDVPDPSLVTPAVPRAVKAVSFQARLSDAPGPMPFHLSSSAGDLAGALSITRSPRLAVEGRVTSRRLDLDALLAAPEKARPSDATPAAAGPAEATASPARPADGTPPAARPSDASASAARPADATGSAKGTPQDAPPPTTPAPQAATPPAKAAQDRKSVPLFSDKPLKLERLRAADASVAFALAQVTLGGGDVGKVEGKVAVKDGVLRLDPLTIGPADRPQRAALEVNAAADPPRAHLTLDAPGVLLRRLLEALDSPVVATGTADIRADLTGTGDSARALAASLDGWAGLAVEGGHVDASLINNWLDHLRPLHIGGPNAADLRCFAVRADARGGVVTIQPSAFNTAALIVEGSGQVDLTNETMAMRVRPRTKIGGTGIALPLWVTGRLRAPAAKVDLSASGGGGGAFAGLLLGGKDIMGAAGGGDPCPAALARAREGAATAPTVPTGGETR